MTSPGGILTALACYMTKKVNKAEEPTFPLTNIDFLNIKKHSCLQYADMCVSSRKMFHLLLKKMFVFNIAFKLFGAETPVTEIWQAMDKLQLTGQNLG